jgi:CrcB protein
MVGLGGAAGSIARFVVSQWVGKQFSKPFPMGTFIINLLGCFIIGLLFGIAQRSPLFKEQWWLLLATGFCGGFTTFSAFALEGNNLLTGQHTITMLVYMALSVVLGLLLCRLGIWLVA